MAENQIVSFNYGLKKDLPEKQEGQLLFATDSKQIYVDINNTRHNFGLVQQAEDNESLIIGDGRDNISGTKGFIIEKAQRITQDDGTYKYYYILRDSDNSLTNDFTTVLKNYPQATYTLRLYHFNNTKLEDGTYQIAREYADDYGKTYNVKSITIQSKPYLRVEVEKVKRTYQPVPDSGNPIDGIKDEEGNYRYIWKPIGDPSVCEIDYTDTYELKDDSASDPDNTPAYSFFRLSVAPELGTHWLPTNGLVAGGSNNRALGKDAFSAGSDNISNGSKAITLGDENYANYSAIAAGKRNKALNKYDIALGYKNEVNAWAGFAAGESNVVKHSDSAAIGRNLKTHNSNELVTGRYNLSTPEKEVALSVGVGTSDSNRKDAMTVYKDGTTKMLGDIYSGSTNVTQTAKNANTAANYATELTSRSNDRINKLETKTLLQLGKLPETGEINKLYITDQDELWIYKIRKNLNIPNDIIPWDGTKSIPTHGSGTEIDPYQVTTSQELAYAVSDSGNHYYELMNDIYINDISNPNWKNEVTQNWLSIQNGTKFKGYFNGNYHNIYGLYYNNISDGYSTDTNGILIANGNIGSALFPLTTMTATIKNIGMDYAYVNSGSVAAALVGNNTNNTVLTVDNCYFGENVELYGKAVACISAWGNSRARITNCYSLATQSKGYNATIAYDATIESSFVIANYWSDSGQGEDNNIIANCYALNTPILWRTTYRATTKDCYCTDEHNKNLNGVTVITKDQIQGINALDNMPNLGDAFINDYTYPHLKSFAEGWHKIFPKY